MSPPINPGPTHTSEICWEEAVPFNCCGSYRAGLGFPIWAARLFSQTMSTCTIPDVMCDVKCAAGKDVATEIRIELRVHLA